MTEELTGSNRCWPCTVANAIVGVLVAGLPLVGALLNGGRSLILLAVGWGMVIMAVTLYRLVHRGYLPCADDLAKVTGLHQWIGPGSNSDLEDDH